MITVEISKPKPLTEPYTYTYDSVWKDKLISYDGKAITYNDMGAPINYMGAKFTWDVKGNLTDIKTGNDTISYTYMSDGKRRTRNVNGKITEYHYNNGMLLSETTGDETLRYYYDSTGKVTSIGFKKGEEEERSYFFTRNVQGDIIAVYRNSDSKLIGTYEYDLWGKPVLTKEAEEGIDTDGILTKNPYRYRGYYYDNETGYYNLPARFYDPQIRRFINADSISALMIATTDVGCKNLFAYAENNPVTGKDGSGAFIDTVFDVISLAGSIVDVCKNPTDPLAWIGLTGDVVDLIPGVSGVGEGAKALCGMAKVADATKGAAKATKAGANVADDVAEVLVKELKDVGEKGSIKLHVPSSNTQIIRHPEIKAPNQVKTSEVTDCWDNYLGTNQTNINPITGMADNNRIFSADGTRSIRFGNHEMNSMGTTKFHFHQEEWKYDSTNDVMEYYNTLVRIK